MRLRNVALLGLCGLAACSHDKPTTQTADDTTYVSETSPPSADPTLTPASLEARSTTSDSTAARSADAPAATSAPATPTTTTTTTTARVDAPGAKVDPPAANQPVAAAPNSAPDNTAVNERDRNAATKTPLDQQENEKDLKITQQIRQAVMADKSLSFTAKNVKIITANGKVTLRGPVNSEQERSAIETAARKIAGAAQVDNQLEVKK